MKTYDFGIGWPEKEGRNELFVKTLASECQLRKMNFIFISPASLYKLNRAIKEGNFGLRFYLDMASETFDHSDRFTRFTYSLKDAGTKIVADPDDVKESADKSITHFDLLSAKIPVPSTIIIRNWEPTRRLTENERRILGFPFVVKPALGYGQKGIKIIKKKRTLKEIAQARRFDRGDNFLLQEFITPAYLGGMLAWFRVYHLFGEIIPCWWNPETHTSQQVTLKEMYNYRLLPLVRITSEIAMITQIDWFSCEIAISERDRRFMVIDYMNDQCAIYPKSKHKDGMPDDLVVHIAERIVEKAWQYIKGRAPLNFRALWFPKIKTKDEDM